MSTFMDPRIFASQQSAGVPAGPAGVPPAPADDLTDLYRTIIELLHAARTQEPDESDRLAVEKITTLVQQLVASSQKDRQGAAGGAGSPIALGNAPQG